MFIVGRIGIEEDPFLIILNTCIYIVSERERETEQEIYLDLIKKEEKKRKILR